MPRISVFSAISISNASYPNEIFSIFIKTTVLMNQYAGTELWGIMGSVTVWCHGVSWGVW